MDRTDHFYASVGAWNREKEAFLATVTEGSSAGGKVFVENGTMQSRKGAFLQSPASRQLCGKGLQRIDGQEVFVQPLGKQAKLVICGAGHVATALIRMAKLLNFEIVVLEDRPLFAESCQKRRR